MTAVFTCMNGRFIHYPVSVVLLVLRGVTCHTKFFPPLLFFFSLSVSRPSLQKSAVIPSHADLSFTVLLFNADSAGNPLEHYSAEEAGQTSRILSGHFSSTLRSMAIYFLFLVSFHSFMFAVSPLWVLYSAQLCHYNCYCMCSRFSN